LSQYDLFNNHASHVFQGIMTARRADWRAKLSAGIAVGVRQRTVNLKKINNKKDEMIRINGISFCGLARIAQRDFEVVFEHDHSSRQFWLTLKIESPHLNLINIPPVRGEPLSVCARAL
jgi:hypothetical protein